MATLAGAGDELVIHRRRCPRRRAGVTTRAIVSCCEMVCALPGEQNIVVARLARRRRLVVLEVDRRTERARRNGVARIADGRCAHTLVVLATKAVATRTATQHLRVIDDLNLCPTRRSNKVAGVAYKRRADRNVARRQAVAARRRA